MKFLASFLLLLSVAACDPYGFGFKKNPAYVLDVAFRSIEAQDHSKFLAISGKEALCLYGNPEGIALLREHVTFDARDVDFRPNFLKSEHFLAPKFVGYWSYYSERYLVDIHQKGNDAPIFQAVVDCDYGTEGDKDDSLVNQKPKKYPKKECRLVKINPYTFEAPALPARCSNFKVNL